MKQNYLKIIYDTYVMIKKDLNMKNKINSTFQYQFMSKDLFGW